MTNLGVPFGRYKTFGPKNFLGWVIFYFFFFAIFGRQVHLADLRLLAKKFRVGHFLPFLAGRSIWLI